jgi:hypothetical protein
VAHLGGLPPADLAAEWDWRHKAGILGAYRDIQEHVAGADQEQGVAAERDYYQRAQTEHVHEQARERDVEQAREIEGPGLGMGR